MAHFVKLDENNVVVAGVVVNNDAIDPTNEEVSGIEFLNNLYCTADNWKQTSYNGNIRKQYAGIGYTYDPIANVFIAPKPYPSWTLDKNFDWQAPKTKPDAFCIWDEENLMWQQLEN